MAGYAPAHGHRPGVIDKLGDLSWPLIAILCALACIGLAALYAAAGGSWAPWAERHAVRFMAGLGVMIAIAVVPLDLWLRLAYPVYGIALAALALVPLIGTEALGARRWVTIGSLTLQPSEMMKIALVAALAAWFQGLRDDRRSHPVWLVVPAVMIAAPMLLVARQPDLGTAMMLGMIGAGMMLLAGVHWLYFAAGGAATAAAVPLVQPWLHDYQRRRIEAFLDPSNDPLGAGYHVMQSKIALGSGGLLGKGFLGGTQGQLDFLPEKHTDFIFTTIAEEWGFVGAIAVLLLLAVLVAVLIGIAVSAASRFARLVPAGMALVVFLYAAINVGMVTGALPVVGIPLPFVSYGGTSMATLMVGLGLAMCAWVHREDRLPRPVPPLPDISQGP